MVKLHILCIELRVVSTLTSVLDTCWVAVSALQHGPVLNHPLLTGIVQNSKFREKRWYYNTFPLVFTGQQVRHSWMVVGVADSVGAQCVY